MPTKHQLVTLLPARTVDTDADPKRARGPLELLNCYVDRAGELRRRPGYTALSTDVMSTLKTAASFDAPTATADGLVVNKSLVALNDAPALLSYIKGTASGGAGFAEPAFVRFDSELDAWTRLGPACNWSYSQQALAPQGGINVSDAPTVISVARIGNVLCQARCRTKSATVPVIDLVFTRVDTGVEISRLLAVTGGVALDNEISARVEAVDGVFVFIYVRDNNTLYGSTYDTDGNQVTADTSLTTDVSSDHALFDHFVYGTALYCVFKRNSTDLVRGMKITNALAVTYEATLWDSVANVPARLAAFPMSGGGSSFHVCYAGTADDIVYIHPFLTTDGSSLHAEVVLVTLAANEAETVRRIAGGYTDSGQLTYVAFSHLKTSTIDSISVPYIKTYMLTVTGTPALDQSRTMVNVELIGKPATFDTGFDNINTYIAQNVVFPFWFRGHPATNDFFLIGFGMAATTSGATELALHVYAKFNAGAVGLGASDDDTYVTSHNGGGLPKGYPMSDVVYFDDNQFGFLVQRVEQATAHTSGGSFIRDTYSSALVRFDPEAPPASYVNYAAGLGAVLEGSVVRKASNEITAVGFLHLPPTPIVSDPTGAGALTDAEAMRFEYVDDLADRYQGGGSEVGEDATALAYNSSDGAIWPYTIEPGSKADLTSLIPYTLDSTNVTLRRIAGKANSTLPVARTTIDPDDASEEYAEQAGFVTATAPCGLTSLLLHNSRIYGISKDNPVDIWFTAVKTSGDGWMFSDEYILSIVDDGPNIGLAAVNDARLAFKGNCVYAFGGAGPNLLGQGTFSTPEKVVHGVGLRDANSLVTTEEGVFFKSADGIYLLNRSMSLDYIGKPVAAYNSLECRRAIHIPTLKQVRFYHTDSGTVLTFDYEHRVWSVLEPTFDPPVDACTVANVVHVATETDVRSEDNETDWLDDATDDAPAEMKFVSEWVHEGGLQGYQRVKWIHVLGELAPRTEAVMKLYYDYSDEAAQTITLPAAVPPWDLPDLGFELAAGWTFAGGGSRVAGAGDEHSGTYVMQGTSGGTSTATATTAQFDIIPGVSITASYWAKSTGGGVNTSISATFYDAQGATISTAQMTSLVTTGTYAQATEGAVTVPATARTVSFQMAGTCGSGRVVYIDDLSIDISGRQLWEHRVKPARQKCKAVKVELTSDSGDDDTNATDWRISDVSLLVDVKTGKLNRLPKER